MQAIKSNFQLGVGIEAVRILLGNFKLLFRSPVKLLQLVIASMNLRLVAFMVGYNALYRVYDLYDNLRNPYRL